VALFQAPKGTFDLLPPRSAVFLAVREAIAAPLRLAGYGYIETPAFEQTALFTRGVGESTDIVSKEMYSFTTKGGDEVTLRPEGTAGVLRAVLEGSLDRQGLPVKLWYSGSYYRYEKPQAGRYRHFSQVGAEVLGTEDPMLDAELIVLAVEAYRSLGLQRFRTLLNSLGCRECRPAYRTALQEFLRGLDLDAETRARIEINPLRVLDDKRENVQAQLRGAPLMADHLCAACREHHAVVRSLLDEQEVTYEDTPTLVRGLDYYTRTTFEFVHDGLGAQSAIGGGGRYDGLAEELGGPQLPGVGWALGVDRTVLAMDAEGLAADAQPACQVYVVPLGDAAARQAFDLVARLRRAGVATDMSYGGRGVKGAMKSADRSGASAALVIGDRDLEAGVAQVKWLESGEQVAVPWADLVQTLKEKLA
jgi:histidyl-tRNA synthetase